MLDMGFIHDVRKIVSLCRGERQTLLFSATMPPAIAKLAHDILKDPVRIDISPTVVAVDRIDQRVLFVGAKISHLALLPQGGPERARRVVAMVEQMEREGFGACSNEGECEAVCPKEISVRNIQRLNREYVRAVLKAP